MPIFPGTRVKRLIPSTTGRDIRPGDFGVVGGLVPTDHHNPSSFNDFDNLPIQWNRSRLWSSLPAFDENFSWEFAPVIQVPQVSQKPKRSRKPKQDKDDFGSIPFKL